MSWRPIPDFEGYYEASEDGQIRSISRIVAHRSGTPKRWPGRVLKQRQQMGGRYFAVNLSADGIRYDNVPVHRLVCSAFHGRCPDGLETRHLNGQSFDNRAENLMWGTRSENILDTVRHGTHRNARRPA